MNPGVNPAVSPVIDDKPRMTAADADARFAALVAEHRAERKSRGPGRVGASSDDKFAALAFAAVYCLGVTAGAIFHVKPLVAILVGAPVVYFVRVLSRRSRGRDGAA